MPVVKALSVHNEKFWHFFSTSAQFKTFHIFDRWKDQYMASCPDKNVVMGPGGAQNQENCLWGPGRATAMQDVCDSSRVFALTMLALQTLWEIK
jgi:hypothetical protein